LTNEGITAALRGVQDAAREVGIEVRAYDVRTEADLDSVFDAITAWPAEALLVASETSFVSYDKRFVEFAAQRRLPAMYAQAAYMQSGGLALYTPRMTEFWARMGAMVDLVLRGIKPADI